MSDSEDSNTMTSWNSRSIGSSTMHACPYNDCKKIFARPSRLKTHLLSHTKEKPFQCSYDGCNNAYARTAHLKRHVENSHENREKSATSDRLACPNCSLTFANKYSLQKHDKTTHSTTIKPAKVYQCSDCEETFVKHQLLKLHRADVHPGLEQPYACPKCHKRFQYPKKLKLHLKKHDGYKCQDCDETFSKWTLLRQHKVRQHDSKQTFNCEPCDRSFSSRNKYRCHLATHEDTRPVFRCPSIMCPRYYYFERNLQHHVQGYHNGRRFPCTFDGCDARLGSRLARVRHLRTVHANEPKPKHGEKKPRKARKDRGGTKLSVAVELSGLPFDPKVDKSVILSSGQFILSPEAVAKELEANSKLMDLIDHDTSAQETTDQEEGETDIENDEQEVFVMPFVRGHISSDDEDEDEDEEEGQQVAHSVPEANLSQKPAAKKKFDFSLFLSG